MRNFFSPAQFIHIPLYISFMTGIAQDVIPSSVKTIIDSYAQEWVTHCASLSPSSQQILANFTYFSYRYCELTIQTSRALMALKFMLPTLHTQMHSHENPFPQTTAYVHAAKKFFVLNGLRYYMYRCWQHCSAYLESLHDPSLPIVYEQLQSHGHSILIEYFSSNNSLAICLTNLKKNLKQTNQHFNCLIHTIHCMFEKTTDRIAISDPTLDIENALCVNKNLQTILEELYQPLAAFDQYERTIFSISAHTFRTYYRVLYPYLPSNYQHILFGPHGLLPTSSGNALPTPTALAL